MSDIFATRRSRLLSALGERGALVIAAAPELRAGSDTEIRYQPSADLYYLTGYTEPEAVLVLCPSAEHPFTLFVRPRDAERELWTGPRGGVDAARELFGAAAAHPVSELAQRLPALLAGAATLYAPLEPGRTDVESAIRLAVDAARRTRPRSGTGVHTITDAHVLLAPLRVRKDAEEVAAIRTAAEITVHAFEDAARGIRTAAHEYVVEATVEHGFRSRGAQGPAFPTIAAGGPRATVLHYTANDAPLVAGELVLLDAGARARMYCADITRTLPVSGRFTPEQRALYDVVLAAHDAVVACATAGRTVTDLDAAALRVLVQGMLDLRLLTGTVEGIIEQREYRRWFPHRVSHWLGLDVHDAGDYALDGTPVALESGMVLTVEPGLYIPAGAASAPPALRGIGIRLEDDLLVTAGDAEVLTGALAIRPEEVEALVRR